jgi:glycosidase
LFYALRDVFAGNQPMTRLQRTFAADTNYVNPRVLVTFLGLHDVGRFMSEPGATSEGLQLAFTFLLTARGTPLIYYGDEIALRGGGDPDNRRDFPGGWPQDERNAFQASGHTVEEEAVYAHVKKLLALRRELEPLRRGDMLPLHYDEQTAAFVRRTGKAAVIMAFNNSTETKELKLKLPDTLATHPFWFNRLTDEAAGATKDGILSISLPPRRAVLLTPQPAVLTSEQGKTQARSNL